MRSTFGRIGLFQVFDDFLPTATKIPGAQIVADSPRYDAVWGARQPQFWDQGNPSMLVSRYIIMQEDRFEISGHGLSWWQTNHPDWIFYACKPDGTPTHELAFFPGTSSPAFHPTEVPLDIHNPGVVDYQIRQLMGPYAITHGYNAIAIDNILFQNVMQGGNPNFGQPIISGYWGCGVWHGSTFVRRYTSKSDPMYATDTVNWLKAARSIVLTDPTLAPHHLALIGNHTLTSTSNTNEQQVIANLDAVLDEAAFSAFGNYQSTAWKGLFTFKVAYMRYAQAHRVAMLLIDKFAQDTTTVTKPHLEYSIATYLMGNEQGAYLYVTPTNTSGSGYGSEQYHTEYTAPVGQACGEMFGGPSFDAANPHIYYRRFTKGFVVVNSGSLPVASERARLPAGIHYTDIEGRAITNPLVVKSNDAFVLTTTTVGCT